jgi:hypothetical protein
VPGRETAPGFFHASFNPTEGSRNMVTRQLRRALDRLIEKQRARSLAESRRGNEVRTPRFSVVIDERVRLEFSAAPRSVSVGPRQIAAGRTPKREALILEVEVW